jgi:hypothetical protein
VPEPVGRALELDRDEGGSGVGAVPAPPARREDRVGQRLPDELRQELVHDEPLVMPGQRAAGRCEPLIDRHPLGGELVDDPVVGEDHRALDPGDDDVLVVARVGDDGLPVGVAGQVLEPPARLDPQFHPVGLVELRARDRTTAVDRVKIEGWRTHVLG